MAPATSRLHMVWLSLFAIVLTCVPLVLAATVFSVSRPVLHAALAASAAVLPVMLGSAILMGVALRLNKPALAAQMLMAISMARLVLTLGLSLLFWKALDLRIRPLLGWTAGLYIVLLILEIGWIQISLQMKADDAR